MIAKGSHVAVVLQCGGLWFANGKFGVTWKLLQGVVKPRETMKGKCHIFLSSEDKARMEAQKVSEDDDEEAEDEPVNTTEVADSDGEEDVKQEVAAVVEEAPKKKKIVKKVVKKAA